MKVWIVTDASHGNVLAAFTSPDHIEPAIQLTWGKFAPLTLKREQREGSDDYDINVYCAPNDTAPTGYLAAVVVEARDLYEAPEHL